MTEMLHDQPGSTRPGEASRAMVVIPRIHDGSGARILYGLVPVDGPDKQKLSFPQGAVDDPDELRAGAALTLARQIGEGMNAAVIAPLGRLYADPHEQQRVDVMLAVARKSCPDAEQMLEDGPVQWVGEAELLRAVSEGRIVDVTTAAAVALLLACGELVR
jgi:8-oxo-dGTP pyrophosphatase MutT (NUDIX family)